MRPSSESVLTRPHVKAPYVLLLTPMKPCELSHWPLRLVSPSAFCQMSGLPLFMTSERWPLARSPEYGLNPSSNVPTTDQPAPIGSLILMPTTDWLSPLAVHSHLGPLLCLLIKLATAFG